MVIQIGKNTSRLNIYIYLPAPTNRSEHRPKPTLSGPHPSTGRSADTSRQRKYLPGRVSAGLLGASGQANYQQVLPADVGPWPWTRRSGGGGEAICVCLRC